MNDDGMTDSESVIQPDTNITTMRRNAEAGRYLTIEDCVIAMAEAAEAYPWIEAGPEQEHAALVAHMEGDDDEDDEPSIERARPLRVMSTWSRLQMQDRVRRLTSSFASGILEDHSWRESPYDESWQAHRQRRPQGYWYIEWADEEAALAVWQERGRAKRLDTHSVG